MRKGGRGKKEHEGGLIPLKEALGLQPVLHLAPDQIACLAAAAIHPAPSCHHTETQTRTHPRVQTERQSTWLWCSSARSGLCARLPMSKKRHRGCCKEQLEQASRMGLVRVCSLCAERGRRSGCRIRMPSVLFHAPHRQAGRRTGREEERARHAGMRAGVGDRWSLSTNSWRSFFRRSRTHATDTAS